MNAWPIVALLLAKYLFLETQEYLAVLISVVIDGMVFLGTHVLRNNGFVLVNRAIDTSYLADRGHHAERSLTTWIKIPWLVIKNAQKQVAQYGAPYMLFGLTRTHEYCM